MHAHASKDEFVYNKLNFVGLNLNCNLFQLFIN